MIQPVPGRTGHAWGVDRKTSSESWGLGLFGVDSVPGSHRALQHAHTHTHTYTHTHSHDRKCREGRKRNLAEWLIIHSPIPERPQGVFVCGEQGQYVLKPGCHSSPDRSGVGS